MSMSIEEAKQILIAKGFTVVDAAICIAGIAKEPVIAVKVGPEHQCSDDWCEGGVHPLATETSIKYMEGVAFEALIREELEGNR